VPATRGIVQYLIARTITVNQQVCRNQTGTPKGRTRRTVPMTETLYEALKRMSDPRRLRRARHKRPAAPMKTK
jgi:hypothetical protein